ncbi:MAG: hypothetical protein HC834_00510 [Rhodospirillales bacterium]|nr:hypothetical protein [Rhodospirillales bacterium]
MFTLADARATGFGPSGWKTSTFDLASVFAADIREGRSLILGFAVINDEANQRPSTLLLDNVRLNAPVAANAELVRSDGAGAFLTYRSNPVAATDVIGTSASETVSIAPSDLLANDKASAGANSITFRDLAEPAETGSGDPPTRGIVRSDGFGISYDPAGQYIGLSEGEVGFDRFTYSITDANGWGRPREVRVEITGVNDAPTTVLDASVANEDGEAVTIAVLANDDDPDSDDDGSTLRLISAEAASGATVTLDSIVGGILTYDPGDRFQELSAGQTPRTPSPIRSRIGMERERPGR